MDGEWMVGWEILWWIIDFFLFAFVFRSHQGSLRHSRTPMGVVEMPGLLRRITDFFLPFSFHSSHGRRSGHSQAARWSHDRAQDAIEESCFLFPFLILHKVIREVYGIQEQHGQSKLLQTKQ
tara:strand:+ start:258 stop:623 length:366 start_codon:yes stop_codon:yes gene_type:complete